MTDVEKIRAWLSGQGNVCEEIHADAMNGPKLLEMCRILLDALDGVLTLQDMKKPPFYGYFESISNARTAIEKCAKVIDPITETNRVKE